MCSLLTALPQSNDFHNLERERDHGGKKMDRRMTASMGESRRATKQHRLMGGKNLAEKKKSVGCAWMSRGSQNLC